MELNKLQESLRDLFNQIDLAYQFIEDGRFIAAHRQVQGAKMRVHDLITKVRDEQNNGVAPKTIVEEKPAPVP